MMHTPPPEDGGHHGSSPHRIPPTKPRPSEDKGFLPPTQAPKDEPDAIPPDAASVDITALSPLAALKLLTAAADAFVRASQVAVPLTPPSSSPNTPRMAGVGDQQQQQQQQIPFHPSPPNSTGTAAGSSSDGHQDHEHNHNHNHDPNSPNSHHHHDVPPPHKTPIGSPETHPSDASSTSPPPVATTTSGAPPAPPKEPFSISPTSTTSTATATTPNTASTSTAPALAPSPTAELDAHLLAQHTALSRKFFSKAPPPIPLGAYLRRLHTYCPMSTAVYLAAAWYLVRLTGELPLPEGHSRDIERAGQHNNSPDGQQAETQPPHALLRTHLRAHPPPVPVPIAPKTAHRLLLAVLRVATKTLEDRTYPHARVAKVGGVSERELGRLEICAAFLLDFELLVREDVMRGVAEWLVRGWWGGWGEGV